MVDSELVRLQLPRSVSMGIGSLKSLAEFADTRFKNTMLISSKRLDQLGFTDKAKESLSGQVVVHTEDDVEPTLSTLERVLDVVKNTNPDLIIGLGGGSVLDVAKASAALATNVTSRHKLSHFLSGGSLSNESIPTVLVPTTAGTGSEVTPNALFNDPDRKEKVALISPGLLPSLVILDPSLTLSLPPHVTATTGIDALTHAIESFVSRKANPYSDILAEKAIVTIMENIRIAVTDGQNITARQNMLIGSMLAGAALSMAGTGAVHALAYPLGTELNVPHGLANSLLLVPVLRHNQLSCSEKLIRIGTLLGKTMTPEAVLNMIDELITELELPRQLSSIGIASGNLSILVKGAMNVTRLLNNNPTEVTESDALTLYKCIA